MIDRFVRLVVIGAVALGAPAAHGGGPPLKVHFISGSTEYTSEASLKAFKEHLEKNYNIACTASWGKDSGNALDDLDALKTADVMIVFARRLKLPAEQMAIIRGHWENGKPIVGIRTASHAFQKDDNDFFDRKVLGGHYTGHYGSEPVKVLPTKEGAAHPILQGVQPLTSKQLYRTKELASDTVVLQTGDIGTAQHPVTIVHTYKGGRVFSTSLGLPEEFRDANFRRLLTNAVIWTAGREEAKLKRPGLPSQE